MILLTPDELRSLVAEAVEPLRREVEEVKRRANQLPGIACVNCEKAARTNAKYGFTLVWCKVHGREHQETVQDPDPQVQRLKGPAWPTARASAIVASGGRCAHCSHSESLNVHHIIPRSRGGSNEQDNLIVLCPNCHAGAHQRLRRHLEAMGGEPGWKLLAARERSLAQPLGSRQEGLSLLRASDLPAKTP